MRMAILLLALAVTGVLQAAHSTTGPISPPGTYTVTWEGRNRRGEPVATGVYICRLRSEGQR